MRVRLLGRVELAEDDGSPVPLSAPKRRAVFCALALELNREVPAERLIEAVWGPSAPPTAKAALQGHVAALRRVFTTGLSLHTGRIGYRLEGDPGQVDLYRFRAWCLQSDRADAETARATLQQALALWEGPALTDCGSDWLLRKWQSRLEEARSRAADALGRADAAAQRTHSGATASAVPAQAPSHRPEAPLAARGFAGREAELAWLDEMLGEPQAGPVTVVGPAGVGKTSLILHWARQRVNWFPDGQLYANLRGFDETEPLTAAAVARTFLLALGTPAPSIPTTVYERIDRLGELLQHRNLLVILDNARNAEQVLPLRPVLELQRTVVTSRNRMDDLVVTHDARPLTLAAPDHGEALQLLRQALGPRAAEDDAFCLERIVELCDRLPLALRIVGARLAARPNWSLSEVARELADEQARMEALTTSGNLGVESALQATCRTLPHETVRMLDLTGLHPGREIDAYIAAALADIPLSESTDQLAQLARAHLMEEVRPGAFARHDLIRLHTQRAVAQMPPEDRSAAMSRMVDQYMATARTATKAVRPWPTLDVAPPAGVAMEFQLQSEAIRWFLAEEATIRALIVSPHDVDDADRWKLGFQTGTLYHHAGGLLSEWALTSSAGLKAAERIGDIFAQAFLLSELGVSHLESGHLTEAAAPLQRALGLADASGDLRERIRARSRYANLLARTGESDRAIALQEEAAVLVGELGDENLAVLVLNNLADSLLLAGRPSEALVHTERLILFPEGRKHPTYQHTHAEILHALGRDTEALQFCEQALYLADLQNSPRAQAHAHKLAGDILAALGRPEDTMYHWRVAISLLDSQKRDTGDLPLRLARLERQVQGHTTASRD